MIDKLKHKVITAPMAGVTDRAFREILQQFGAGLVFTEMVSAKGLYHKDKKTKTLLDIGNATVPVCAQIFGHEPDIIAKTAHFAAMHGASYLDINSGCPTPKITKNGDGAALAKNPELFGEIVSSAVKNAGIPVTVKIRSGWDDCSINAVQMAKIAEENGASMVTVHGRTAASFYRGRADWDIIKKVVSSVNIPVVGNGDVFCSSDAKEMLDKTGCAAVMIGRGMLGNPWLIRETVYQLENKELPPPVTIYEKKQLALHHVRLIIQYKGEYAGIREARKHVLWYIKGIRGSAGIKNLISKAKSYDEMKEYITYLNEL